MHLIEVAFKGNRKDFFLWEAEEAPPARSAVIVEADRGEDLGWVYAPGELAEKRNAGTPHGYGASGTRKRARRLASSDDVARAAEVRVQDEDARRRAAERVRANDLAMKLSDAEWQWDRKKLTLYFTAERRVDFRTLVRELASMFRTRIELKQIGVRDEAKRLDGIGRCGRQYCSASWLPELRPVNLGVAKDQRLSLNPSQISGACGRLMCCLRYEHDFYVQSRKKFPKEGRAIRTARGEEKVISNDIFRERVTLRGADGELRTILLVDLRAEAEGAGAPMPMAAGASPLVADEETVTPINRSRRDDGDGDEALFEAEVEIEEPFVADVIVADAPGETPSVSQPAVVDSAAEPVVSLDAVGDAVVDAPDAAGPAESPGERDKRPHRRRGRRGGRRNRSGGRGANGAADGEQGTNTSNDASDKSDISDAGGSDDSDGDGDGGAD